MQKFVFAAALSYLTTSQLQNPPGPSFPGNDKNTKIQCGYTNFIHLQCVNFRPFALYLLDLFESRASIVIVAGSIQNRHRITIMMPMLNLRRTPYAYDSS